MTKNDQSQEENICRLIPRDPTPPPNLLEYVSQFREQTKREEKKVRKPHANFGLQHNPDPDPRQFLKKQSKNPMTKPPDLPRGMKKTQCKVDTHCPAELIKLHKPRREFVKVNKREVKNMENKNVPDMLYVDTQNGRKHMLDPSGLKLKYVFKKNMGKVPGYLNRRIEEMKADRVAREREEREEIEAKMAGQISEEERQALLQGLKENWARLNKAYSAQSLCIDNLPKLFRKEALERRMTSLEKDIDLIERNTNILIANRRGGSGTH